MYWPQNCNRCRLSVFSVNVTVMETLMSCYKPSNPNNACDIVLQIHHQAMIGGFGPCRIGTKFLSLTDEKKKKLTVMLRYTVRLSWSQVTKTNFAPTLEMSMERGKRKKTARVDSNRQTRTDTVTYNFLKGTNAEHFLN